MNAFLCGFGYNLRKILARVRLGVYRWAAAWSQGTWWIRFMACLHLQAAKRLPPFLGAIEPLPLPPAAGKGFSRMIILFKATHEYRRNHPDL